MFSVVTKYHKGRHSLFLYNSEIFYAFTQDILRSLKFTWYTKNNRKDADNIAFAKKFVLDGFMKAGLLGNDNRKHITGFQDEFAVDKRNPRVEIDEITEEE